MLNPCSQASGYSLNQAMTASFLTLHHSSYHPDTDAIVKRCWAQPLFNDIVTADFCHHALCEEFLPNFRNYIQ
jgi:hypothetical protein